MARTIRMVFMSLLIILIYNVSITHSSVSTGMYATTRTCNVLYGSVLHSQTSVNSVIACARACTRIDTCRSAMYDENAAECSLNNSPAGNGALPSTNCGIIYLLNLDRTNDTGSNLGSCFMTSDCNVNGSVCVSGACSCDVGLTFNQDDGVCTSASDFSVCSTSDWCFPAVQNMQNPWTNGPNHLEIEMNCTTSLPASTIPAGLLRIAVTTDVPVTVGMVDGVDPLIITDKEIIFTNQYLVTDPRSFIMPIIYYGHVLSWNGSIPHCDVPVPQTQCRLLYLES